MAGRFRFRLRQLVRALGGGISPPPPNTHLTINGTNFLDETGNVWIPYGMSDGHFELAKTGDEALDAAMGATCLRSVVREYGTYGTGYQQDMQEEGQPGNLKPAYLSGLVTRWTAARAAGMRNFVAMDSDKGQGAEASGGNDFFSGSTEGNRQRALFIASAVYLAQNYGDLIDAMEPLVEPNSAVVPNKETLWAYQEEFMTAVLAVAPHMLFAIGPRDYASGNIANCINPAWLVPGNAFYGHVFATCNFLDNLSMNASQRVVRADAVVAARAAAGVPTWINQIATHNSNDPDNSNLDATMTLLDQSSGGPIGYNYWERVSMAGTADGLYYLSNTGDPNSSRLSHPERIAMITAHFTGTSGVDTDTWEALQLLAANLGPNNDFNTRVFVNANNQGRAWANNTDPYGDVTNVTLKSDGYPASGQTATRVFLSDLQDGEAGTWLFECTGNMAGAGKIDNMGGGSFGTKSYNSSTNKTTFSVTVNGASDNIIAMRFNSVPADFGGVKLHPPGYPLDTTKVFRDEALAHFGIFKTLRFMDWLETNGNAAGPNTDTDWATSRAAKYDDINGYPKSQKACFDLATATGAKNIWTNAPARATNDYFAGMIADGAPRRPSGALWLIEYGNELWNGNLGNSTAYQDIRVPAFLAADVRAGSDYIQSITKASNGTVTMVLKAGHEHTKNVGDVIYFDVGYVNSTPHYQGFDDPGTRTITSVPNSSTLVWVESAGAATATIQGDNTYVFLNRSHTLCRDLTNYQQPGPVHPNDVRIRYMLQRCRALYDAIVAAGQTANIKVILGAWLASIDIYTAPLLWALEEYGSMSWLYGLTPALYMEPDNMNSGAGGINSVTDVFTKLDEDAANVRMPKIWGWNNFLLSLGIRAMGYEFGPHTHLGDGTSTPYIVAAHSDDRMRQRLKSWLQSWRNRGGSEMNFFHAGITKAPTSGNSTWGVTYGTYADDATSVKYAAFAELSAESAAAVQENGVNFGTILYNSALANGLYGQAVGQRVIRPEKSTTDISITVAVNAPGTYTLAIDAARHTDAAVAYTAYVDGVQVSTGNLPSVNVFTTVATEAFSVPVTFTTKGNHTVTLHVPNASRADWVALYRVRLT